ncbi:MAG: hypothetical protein NWE76_01425, partial [Candidatus Bathyarchaeota archaeon]|nr:hypothetical protein [Candidatus Bathyarchaeota archaeon]
EKLAEGDPDAVAEDPNAGSSNNIGGVYSNNVAGSSVLANTHGNLKFTSAGLTKAIKTEGDMEIEGNLTVAGKTIEEMVREQVEVHRQSMTECIRQSTKEQKGEQEDGK